MDSFAEAQMKKHGWREGKGLGRKENGICEPIKVKMKKDTTGVGHDPGEQFTHHWWDEAYKNATNNIHVQVTENGVKVQSKEESKSMCTYKVATKLRSRREVLYGRFVKSGTLTGGVMDGVDSSDTSEDEIVGNNALSDEQLFKVCGGRTAHKGARHGLKLSGKLERLAQQESKDLLVSQVEAPAKKKKKKKKAICKGDSPTLKPRKDNSVSEQPVLKTDSTKKKKKRKKHREKEAADENVVKKKRKS
uniref:G patch domain-containing protein 4 n=1 Tax=Ciona intestinalis TaxID=7719 RepID=F6QN05_CIOIN|nr:G patch domain-containing protein 4-like [Ciona intestinalis]|eukprot:XP_002126980.1 G patch domain-containing protein 4-like [Ciona intestinalis]